MTSKEKGKLVGYLLAAIVALMAMSAVGWVWRYYTAAPKGIVEAEEQINSGHSRIQKYNQFFDLCSVIQTNKTQLRTQKDMLEMAESADERQRIRATIAGVKAQLNRNVNQYNADSHKEYTAARFKASSLPYEINASQEIITCK